MSAVNSPAEVMIRRGMSHAHSTPDIRPQLVVRVGVTGHRDLRAFDLAELKLRARGALQAVVDAAQAIAADESSGYARGGVPPQLRIISSIAEGADRLVAREALAMEVDPPFALQCPLPFAREVYALDFATAESKREYQALLQQATAVLELDGQRTNEAATAAYMHAGQTMLAHCDVLIAVWDGQPVRPGKTGGTADIVREAEMRDIPIIWLPPGRAGEIVMRLGRDGAAEPRADEHRDWRIAMRVRLDEVLRMPGASPPARATSAGHAQDDPGTSPEEFHECVSSDRSPHTPLGGVWRGFVRLLSPAAPEAAKSSQPASPKPQAVDPFAEDYQRGNRAAMRYAGLYRGAFLLSYALGAVAVWLALLVFVTPEPWHRWLFVAEFLTIAAIIALIRLAKVRRWHARSIDLRFYAEQLRQMRYLWPLGRAPASSGPPAHAAFGDPRGTCMHWRFRAALRQAGMPGASMTPQYLRQCLDLMRNDWLGGAAGQMRYHEALAQQAEVIDRRLHALAWWCFMLTAVGCAAHLVPQFAPLRTWLAVGAGGLPAIAAAAHATASRGEFHRIAKRSRAMAARLTQTVNDLDALCARPEGFTSLELWRAVEPASTAMMEEVTDWRILYDKPPISPA